MDLPVMPTVLPMLATATGDEIPDEDGLIFEPKWDGFRCLVFRDGSEITLQSRNEKPFERYVPELLGPLLTQLPQRCVIDGELVVVTDGRLDFEALQARIHPAASRVARLAAETPTSYVAFDLLALGDRDLRDQPFSERRRLLEGSLGHARPPCHLTPATTDRALAAEWFARFEGAGIEGLIAKRPDDRYVEGKRISRKIKHRRTADCVAAGFRLHKDGAGVGSLLLGCYDHDGNLHHLGVASGFSAARRAELLTEVGPLRVDTLEGHPWASWARDDAHDGSTRMPGTPSRWNAQKDLTFEPLRPERVVEVAYDAVISGRFRHSTRMVRWRSDRGPESCTFDQFESPEPLLLDEIVSPATTVAGEPGGP